MQVLDFIHCVSVAARIVKKKKKSTGHWCYVHHRMPMVILYI